MFNDNALNSFTFSLQLVPKHGVLRMAGTNLKVGDMFVAQKVRNHQIVYEHDGSDTISDSFSFVVGSNGLSPEMKSMVSIE